MTNPYLPRPVPACTGRFALPLLLAPVLCLSPVSVRADQLSTLAWNCWAAGQDPLRISCVHERSQPLPKGAPEDTDIELETQLNEQLREKGHRGKAPILAGMEWQNIEILHRGAQWTVQVRAYPSATILDDKQIAKVVKAVLCPANMPCEAKVRKPVDGEISGQGG